MKEPKSKTIGELTEKDKIDFLDRCVLNAAPWLNSRKDGKKISKETLLNHVKANRDKIAQAVLDTVYYELAAVQEENHDRRESESGKQFVDRDADRSMTDAERLEEETRRWEEDISKEEQRLIAKAKANGWQIRQTDNGEFYLAGPEHAALIENAKALGYKLEWIPNDDRMVDSEFRLVLTLHPPYKHILPAGPNEAEAWDRVGFHMVMCEIEPK